LKILFDNILIINNNNEDNGRVWVQYMKEGEELSRGVYPKKKRKSKKNKMKKNRFDNQVTIICKNNGYMPNIKIFKNGNIQLTGIKNTTDTEVIVNHIIDNIINIYNNIDKDIINNREDNYELNLKYQNFKIRMINTDFKSYMNETLETKFLIRRKILHKILISETYNNKCSFEPGRYHGVKLEYFWNTNNTEKNGICTCEPHCFGKGSGQGKKNCKKITVAIFESGSVLITGGISFEQIQEAYDYITVILNKHKTEIQKSDLNLLLLEN
jgi:TATA-box binding protein (TBP) (component of TFIID and TFIIIB)